MTKVKLLVLTAVVAAIAVGATATVSAAPVIIRSAATMTSL